MPFIQSYKSGLLFEVTLKESAGALKKPGFIFIILMYAFSSKAQQANCTLLPSQFTIHFGAGNIQNVNSDDVYSYRRISHYCPPDGFYSFVPYTSSCFNDDWHTLYEDHTAGDANGNMLLVNAGRAGSVFLKMAVPRLKSNTVYELGLWVMNLCRPTKKCPSLLLPVLNIRLETPEGKVVANIVTGELPRFEDPTWIQHRALFNTPAETSTLMLVMSDQNPSGCGNDFALDDITFRECVKQVTQAIPKTTSITKPSNSSKKPVTSKPVPKKVSTSPQKKEQVAVVTKLKTDTVLKANSVTKTNQKIITSIPLVLKTRENPLIKRFETEAGEIKIDLYDNGEIDGDTISIYHNNALLRSHMRLTQKPISFTIGVDPLQPHHEIIMVAENLGSIPPNTSVMIITTASKRYEVLISSSEQKNAKVVFDLKK